MDKTNLLLAAAFSYKYGAPILEDREYDNLKEELGSTRNWEEAVDIDLIRDTLVQYNFDFSSYELTQNIDKEEDLKLQERFPVKTSMEMLTDEEVFLNKYLSQLSPYDVMIMVLKIDGWGYSAYYTPGEELPVFAKTRGRDEAEYSVITKLARLILPPMQVDKLTEVTGEITLKKEALDVLRNAYPDKNFKNTRNSVSSFVYKTIDIERFRDCIQPFVFNIEREYEDKTLNKLEEYKLLESLGFTVPPYLEFVPGTYKASFDQIQKYYKDTYSNYIECDGVVVQASELETAKNMKSVTSLGLPNNVAIKYGVWEVEILYGVVEKVIFPKAKTRRGCVIILENGCVSRTNSTIKRVNGFNLRNVAERNHIKKGTKVAISYHSQQNVVLLHAIHEQEEGVSNENLRD